MSKKVFFPYLDTLRFLAFFIVFSSHVYRDFQLPQDGTLSYIVNVILKLMYAGGAQGVYIFFVLSGFLITYLLVEEVKETGSIKILHFYFRRMLRIWPLYYLIFIIGFFILPHFFPSFISQQSKCYALFFLVNYDSAISHFKWNPSFIVAWSVAIEEQFYLVFPIYFLLFFSNRLRYYLITGLIVISSLMIFYQYEINWISHYYTFSNIGFLMIGSMGAYLINYDSDRIGVIPFAKKYSRYILAATLFFLLVYEYVAHDTIYYRIHINQGCSLVLTFLYLLIIVRICFGSPLRGKIFKITNQLGVYSYGLYFYHHTIIFIIRDCFDKFHLEYRNSFMLLTVLGILSFTLTLLVSYLSYTYFEKFFLQFKNKYATIISGKAV